MGGFFGAVCKEDAISDAFFGTDYHSHLGTCRGGMAAYDPTIGLQREIHNIQNSPFRTKFEHIFDEMRGTSAMGCISDADPQPLLIRSKLGTFAIAMVGVINNTAALIDQYFTEHGGYYSAMTGGRVNSLELLAALISQRDSFAEGIRFAQQSIEGSASILILKEGGNLIAARDLLGRTPVQIGERDGDWCASFESFACQKLGYTVKQELGPGEIVELSLEKGVEQLAAPGEKMRMCAFLWTYYGYPASSYEGMNVETMRNRDGAIMARHDAAVGSAKDVDFVSGLPDSGTPHAIGYANQSHIPFARPYIKYTPTWARSFTPQRQAEREKVAKMKQIPIHDLIEDKNLLFMDDSIVRGTQLRETVEFLYENGAKAVHMRSGCPPIMYSCKYLNFSRSNSEMELLARRVIVELEGEAGFEHLEEYSRSDTERGKNLRRAICEKFQFSSLEFQSLEGVLEAIGVDPCKLCTYCWNGKE
ncbi:MAG: amidophosphoribosyltransferase [Clostridia bacterium]|nr:amidophosphoribosyltransferase [Clostridia bacterium]